MLDINYYRFAEEKAKNSLPSWLISKRYNLEIFEKEGFPVRLNNNQQLKQIFNTMQEDRFNIYMNELGGLSKDDLKIFINALKKSIEFQILFFPKSKTILPLDTLMAFFTIYKKIYSLNKDVTSILEIGPGSGFSPFFFDMFSSLKNYTYTDACESFYMLQNHINHFLFKENFFQHTIEDEQNDIYVLDEISSYSNGGIEKDLYTKRKLKNSFKSNSYPWWKLNHLVEDQGTFDIVTSNANLLEFSEGALNDYLSIIQKKLSENGLFFVHCPGYNLIRTFEYLVNKLIQFKFAIIFHAKWTQSYTCTKENKEIKKRFRVPNMIVVKEGHELYDKFYGKTDIPELMLSGIKQIDEVFLPNSDYYKGKIIYSKEDIKNILLNDENYTE